MYLYNMFYSSLFISEEQLRLAKDPLKHEVGDLLHVYFVLFWLQLELKENL